MNQKELRDALFAELEGNYNEEEKRAVCALILARGNMKTIADVQEDLREQARIFVWTAQHWGERE